MLRFTMRELLLLTVTAALGIAWCVERSTRSRLSDELKSRNAQLEVLRADFVKGPVNVFNMETERLRKHLTKRKPPLVRYLWTPERKNSFYPNKIQCSKRCGRGGSWKKTLMQPDL